MPLKGYGIFCGTPTGWDTTSRPDHGHITFTDGENSRLDAAVNIQSASKDSRLVYWVLRDLTETTFPLLPKLQRLGPGFHAATPSSGLGLDFLRGGFLDVNKGILVSNDSPDTNHDILHLLNPILNRAWQESAGMYLFGQRYNSNGRGNGRDGIHDIHMNQGNSGKWKDDNGTFQDGGIVLSFPDGHWEGVFLAFAVQTYRTDNRGYPVGDSFAALLEGAVPPPVPPTPTEPGEEVPGEEGPAEGVSIEAALVNPIGPDQKPRSGPGETVYLLNRGTLPVSLEGWQIENGAGQSQSLHGLRIEGLSKKAVAVPAAPLSNKGGSIVLRNAGGDVVHAVKYTKKQADREGSLVYFPRE